MEKQEEKKKKNKINDFRFKLSPKQMWIKWNLFNKV